MTNNFPYPFLGFGLGLRSQHYDFILQNRPSKVDWFEIITENFIDAHEGYWQFLADLRNDYPIIMHGVSMSIGSTDPINYDYLQKIKKLADFINPPWISDHLCWTGVNGKNSHDLLPVFYNEVSLSHIIDRTKKIQDYLGCNILLENPSTYLEFKANTMSEWQFLANLVEEADCGILLDVNNVYVSSFNHGFSPYEYIDAIPSERIVQIHLAGHKNLGTHIIDTHDNFVLDEVWELYDYTIKTKGKISTMIEWDENIPDISELFSELDKARRCAGAEGFEVKKEIIKIGVS